MSYIAETERDYGVVRDDMTMMLRSTMYNVIRVICHLVEGSIKQEHCS